MFSSGLQLLAVLVTLLEAYIKVQVCVRSVCLHNLLHHTNLTSSSGEEGWNENIKRKISLIPCYFMCSFVNCEMLYYCCTQAVSHELSKVHQDFFLFLVISPLFNITMSFFLCFKKITWISRSFMLLSAVQVALLNKYFCCPNP